MSGDLQHGGALDRVAARFSNAPTPWVDLSTGINPWPWPAGEIEHDSLHRLPTHRDMNHCREAMAQAFAATPSTITLVPGTEIAIRLLPQALGARRVAVLSPTYGDHAESWNNAGAEVVETADPLSHSDNVDAVVLCNPNNPDGRRFTVEELSAASARLAQRGGWLIVDEAYADLDPARSVAPLAGAPGLVVLRSTGKFFGLPGLRLGAVLGPPELAAALERLLGVWRIAGPALTLGAQAYADVDWQAATRRRLASARMRLDTLIKGAGARVAGGTDLFRYVAIDDAHATWHRLCEHGVYTRRFEWTRTHLRMGLPATPEAEALLANALSLAR
ncbi:MAG: threonine-phosphate decarboxylase CobD [Pseudomonadota bacterium]